MNDLSILTEEHKLNVTVETENQQQPIEILKFSYMVYTNVEPTVGVSPMKSSITELSQVMADSDEAIIQNHNLFLGMSDFSGP